MTNPPTNRELLPEHYQAALDAWRKLSNKNKCTIYDFQDWIAKYQFVFPEALSVCAQAPAAKPDSEGVMGAEAFAKKWLMSCKLVWNPFMAIETVTPDRDQVIAAIKQRDEQIRAAAKAECGVWQPIETAPKDERILAAIWHGGEYQIVIAGYASKYGNWHDERAHSCVGWTPKSKQAYWMPLPPAPSAGNPKGAVG